MPNQRLYYAIAQVAVKDNADPSGDEVGTSSGWEVVRGVQSVSVTTTFNLEQVFEQQDTDNPFMHEQLVLCSIQFLLHNQRWANAALDSPWDLLIVDEAHHLAWQPEAPSPAYSLVEELLCELTGAEAGLVVNNNAAAVLLCLDTLAKGKEVVVSRGQLVEIGGSFRIPDVMVRSGARLVEVGATNRTHLRDYEAAITDETAMLLKVHTSNYRVIGFSSEVELAEMVELAGRHNLPVMEDLGSGCLIDLSRFGLLKEPTVKEVIAAGADVVTFSGDKLLGGPQAGIILGSRVIIDRIKRNPMNRALRIDKFTLAGLEAILRLYFDERQAVKTIPTLAMLSMKTETIGAKARRLIRRIKNPLAGICGVSTLKTVSRVGGGALPEQDLATVAVSLRPEHISLNELETRLRKSQEPVIGRIENDNYILDMRTVSDDEIARLAAMVLQVFEVS